MGRYLIKHPDHIRRAQRLSMFCKEIKRALLGLCVDHDVSISDIDFFMEDFFVHLEYHELEYSSEHLLTMLLDDGFIQHTFDRFRENH